MMKDTDQEIGQPTKVCTKCGEEKPLSDFYKKKDGRLGVTARCITCSREDQTEYRTKNAVEHRKRNAEYRAKNPEKVSKAKKRWKADNIESVREGAKNRMRSIRSTKRGRVDHVMSVNVRNGLTRKSKGSRRWESLVGYTADELVTHLEKQFLPGMTWENYGTDGWHIDHIIPRSAFNYEKPEDIDFKRCWTLSNLQPLWAADNIRKSNKLIGGFQPYFAIPLPTNENISTKDAQTQTRSAGNDNQPAALAASI